MWRDLRRMHAEVIKLDDSEHGYREKRQTVSATPRPVGILAPLARAGSLVSMLGFAGMTEQDSDVFVYLGAEIARYGFGEGHPFGLDRHDVFVDELGARGLDKRVSRQSPAVAERADIELFHTPKYIDWVKTSSERGTGVLDHGDTPAFAGVYEAAASVAGTTLKAAHDLMAGRCRRAFIPIAGLHHAARSHAAGFCVFNDCGIAAEALRRDYDLLRVAYVDIDAHHGDGVYYGFEEDPLVLFADIHEDGRFLYPGTGSSDEIGIGEARGTKLNIPLRPGAGDKEFLEVWQQVEEFLEESPAQFFLFQCGADSLAGDPITHLAYSEKAHAHAAARLCEIADRQCDGRVLAMGGGGYDRPNLARAWTAVVESFVDAG